MRRTRAWRRSGSRWGAVRWRSTSGRAAPKTAAERKAALDTFAKATDTWTQSAIVAAATEQVPMYVASALAYERPQALTELVAAVMPAAAPDSAGPLLVSAAAAGPGASALKAVVGRAISRMDGAAIVMDAATAAALQKLLDESGDDRGGAADRRQVGQVRRVQRQRRAVRTRARRASSAPRRRATSAAPSSRRASSPFLQRRAEALGTLAPMLADKGVSEALKARIITTLGESAGSDVDTVMVAAFARTGSTLLFDQILRRPDASVVLLAALEGRLGHARDDSDRRTSRDCARTRAGRWLGRRPRSSIRSARRGRRRARSSPPSRRKSRSAGDVEKGQGPLHRHVRQLP